MALKATQQETRVSVTKASVRANKASALSALALVVWASLIACVMLTISSLIFETDAWQLETFTEASLKSWLSLGFIVYVSTLIGFGLWAYLLSQNTASKVMPFALLVPIFGMVTSVLLIGEMMTWWKMLAMMLILSGLLLANVKIKMKRRAI